MFEIGKHTYEMSSLLTNIKANKPAGITDKHIDLLFDIYFNK